MSVPYIEIYARRVLKREARENALNFIGFLKEEQMSFRGTDGYWEVTYLGEVVCYIYIDYDEERPGPWTIYSTNNPGFWFNWAGSGCGDNEQDDALDEKTKQIVWESVSFCGSCGDECNPGRSVIIFGRVFENVCSSTLAFSNPDNEKLACAKKMVENRKRDILNSLNNMDMLNKHRIN